MTYEDIHPADELMQCLEISRSNFVADVLASCTDTLMS